MTSAISADSMPELVLKTTPPRSPRHLLVRRRLSQDDERFRDRQVIVVQAPPGFGKTSLLAQWRREMLAHGAAVAWISSDEHTDPSRFLQSLVYAVRVGCGKPTFGRTLFEGSAPSASEFEGATAWLAEVAQASLNLVLMVDEAERLPPGAFAILSYLLHNAPPNLRLVVAARSGVDRAVTDLCTYGQCVVVATEQLRFRLDETLDVVRSRYGTRVDTDSCARIHEIVEGWPLGLQLALAALDAGEDPRTLVEAMSARTGSYPERLLGAFLQKLGAEDTAFLTRISIADLLHPDLCSALTDLPDSGDRLARLSRDIPIFVSGDDSEWSRLHNLARDALRARFAELPPHEQAELHSRAMRWLESHGMLQEAARHALAAGNGDVAYGLAEQCLYDAAMQGHVGMVFEWVEFLPDTELDRRPKLRLAVAWVLSLSERYVEAERLVARILEDPRADAGLRYECALIRSGAAFFADDPDRFIAFFEPWADIWPQHEPRLQQLHANRRALVAILRGDPALARRELQQAPRHGEAYAYPALWGEFTGGLSYLWEGKMRLAEESLRVVSTKADDSLGRRHPMACMLAALLAVATYEGGRVDEAAGLLANRLDVLERTGTPESALLAYRTAARVAAAQGVEHRALELLESLFTIGVVRNMPRLCIVSLAEQVRMHAGRFRSETCRALSKRIDEIATREEGQHGAVWLRMVELLRVVAHANAAIAAQDWGAAADVLARAAPLADGLRLGRSSIEIMALRAYALDRNSEHGGKLLREALDLADSCGLVRVFVDAHPAIAAWASEFSAEGGPQQKLQRNVAVARAVRPRPDGGHADAGGPRVIPSMVLTPKEREVLELIARNLSNKEVAQAMAVGEETVKWHLKNLFGKLDASNRKHLVRRAQILGLLENGD